MEERDRAEVDRVLSFWFGPQMDGRWFEADDDADARVRAALADDHARAAAGECTGWRDTARGCLALVILLDQVPRNIFRGRPEAFATDAMAREVTRHALENGLDQQLEAQIERMFLYLPLEHSENLADQEGCCLLMAGLDESREWYDWAIKHRDIVARFGRFPQRNAALGRENTAEEEAFLATATPF